MAVWDELVVVLKEWLEVKIICPGLGNLILNVAYNCKIVLPIEVSDDLAFEGISAVFKSQKAIGWRLFLDGCLSHEWIRIQQNNLECMGSMKLGRRWRSK